MVYKQNNNLNRLPTIQMIGVNMYAKTKMIKRHCFDQTVSQTNMKYNIQYLQTEHRASPGQDSSITALLPTHLLFPAPEGEWCIHWSLILLCIHLRVLNSLDCSYVYDYHHDRLSKQWGSLIVSIARRRIASTDWPVSCSKGPPCRSDMRRRRSDRSYVECRSDWRWTLRVPELYQAL